MTRLTVAIAAMLMLALPAYAQDDVPDDTIGSGAITVEQLQEDLEVFISGREGIVVFYVLPRGWSIAEQGIDPDTGEYIGAIPKYIVGSRSPVIDEKEAPDMVFELNIYRLGLLDDMDEGLSEEEIAAYESARFGEFLDQQLSQNITLGLDCVSQAAEIAPKPYGVGNRPPTYFVPIYYQSDGGAMIYTFTSVTAGKVWMLKFLVQEEQVENYQALVALVVNNAFAMSDEEFVAWQEHPSQQGTTSTNQ